jgi:hypothetical protein
LEAGMRMKSRSLVWVAGAALATALSFGPATPKASAWDGESRFAFSGRFVGPHARVFVRGVHFPRFAHRPFFVHRSFFARRPFVRVHRPFFRPFRSVRVFVYDPFPHWVVRRVYDDSDCYVY